MVRSTRCPKASGHTRSPIPLPVLLWGALIVVLVAGVLLSLWWSRRFRLPSEARTGGFAAEDAADPADPEDLRAAVESGRSALQIKDGVRTAVIACYVAMEHSLAKRGATRSAADTPDELLARATRNGLVHGGAAGRLTALFYEARFSSHPMDPGQRDAAERALDEIAGTLAEPTQAGAGP